MNNSKYDRATFKSGELHMETELERNLRHDRVSGRRALFLAVVAVSTFVGSIWWFVAGL